MHIQTQVHIILQLSFLLSVNKFTQSCTMLPYFHSVHLKKILFHYMLYFQIIVSNKDVFNKETTGTSRTNKLTRLHIKFVRTTTVCYFVLQIWGFISGKNHSDFLPHVYKLSHQQHMYSIWFVKVKKGLFLMFWCLSEAQYWGLGGYTKQKNTLWANL